MDAQYEERSSADESCAAGNTAAPAPALAIARAGYEQSDVAESDLDIDIDIQYADECAPPRVAQSNWLEMLEGLTEEFFERKKRRLVERVSNNAKACKTVIERDSGERAQRLLETPDFATDPPVRRSKLQKSAIAALTAARYHLFETIRQLSDQYCAQNALAPLPYSRIDDRPALLGFHVIAAAKQIGLAFSDADYEVMLSYFETRQQERLDRLWSSACRNAIDSAALLSRLDAGRRVAASAAADPSPPAGRKTRILERACARTVIDWPTWCKLFDLMQLKVLKNGMVW